MEKNQFQIQYAYYKNFSCFKNYSIQNWVVILADLATKHIFLLLNAQVLNIIREIQPC